MDAVEDYAKRWIKIEVDQDPGLESLSDWVRTIRSLVQGRVNYWSLSPVVTKFMKFVLPYNMADYGIMRDVTSKLSIQDDRFHD